jgi:hypothetical protein
MENLIEVYRMAKITIDVYEVEIKMSIRKKYWDTDNGIMTKEILKDKIQQGIEVPIENISAEIKND